MTRLGFLINRRLRRDAPLVAMSVPQRQLINDLSGKRVALVGNARALAGTRHGQAIDAQDLVIRINRAPMPADQSHGTRTDWLALATSLPAGDRSRLAPSRYLWMSHKRKRLDWATATSTGFYMHPLSDYEALKARIGSQPTTGAMLIDLLARSDVANVDLFGFDFFASLSASGRRTADQVPHDFGSERDWAMDLLQRDARFTLHRME